MLTCSSARIECNGQVRGIPGAVFQSFETLEEAERAYRGAKQRGEVEIVRKVTNVSSPSARTKRQSPNENEFGIEPHGDHFQSMAPSQRRDWIYAGTMLSPNSLLQSPNRSLPPSPPTGVTQYMKLEDTPRLQQPSGLLPRVSVDDTSYTASPLVPTFHPAQIRKVQVVPTSSMMYTEKSSSPRIIRRQETAPASFEMGARYPTVEEVRNGQGLDPRVMRPPSRIFDPANVKPRPKTSPVVSTRRKRSEDDHMDIDPTSPCDASKRLVPDRLSAIHCQEEDETSSICSSPRRRFADKGKNRALADDATEVFPVFGRFPSNRPQSFAEYSYHIQEVYTAGRPEHRNTVIVHCPVGNNCCHGQCGSMSASATVRSDVARARPHYVDAEVTPILPSIGLARETSFSKTNAREPVVRVSDASSEQSVHSVFGLSSSPQVSYRKYAVESDVRSPFARGTRIPSGLSE